MIRRFLPFWVAAPFVGAAIAFLFLSHSGSHSSQAGASVQDMLIQDSAGIISETSKRHMRDMFTHMLADMDIELGVVTVPTLGNDTIDHYANYLFQEYQHGGKTRGNRGVLLVVAVQEKQVRLEVSYDLEGIYTDAFVGYVEQKQMAPYFTHNSIGPGIEATVELIAGRAFEQIRKEGLATQQKDGISGFRSGGAGATESVAFGNATQDAPAVAPDDIRQRFGAQPTPALAWERFIEYNRHHITDTTIDLFDDQTKAIFSHGFQTEAGQDTITRLYDGKAYTVREKGDLAAIVFLHDPDHLLAPWFFHKTAKGWQVNGAMYPDTIVYNYENQWGFKRIPTPYEFAFTDFSYRTNTLATYRGGSIP